MANAGIYKVANPYPPRPQWSGQSLGNFPIHPAPDVASNRGYDVKAPQLPAARRTSLYNRANGYINNNEFRWPLFIQDISIDLALSGSTAQSEQTRDFYARNFTMPSFVMQGQSIDQEDYGMLCEFIRQAQRSSLAKGTMLQLSVIGGGANVTHGTNRGVTQNGSFHPNKRMRGVHKPILCQGYVGSMPRQHRKGVVAPTYTLTFQAAVMLYGIYVEDHIQVQEQQDWVAILKSIPTMEITPGLKKENQQVLDYAKQNLVNIIA